LCFLPLENGLIRAFKKRWRQRNEVLLAIPARAAAVRTVSEALREAA
jgi:hypothetical protein